MDLKKYKKIGWHILAWLLFLGGPIIVGVLLGDNAPGGLPQPPQFREVSSNQATLIRIFALHLYIILFYYLNSNLLINKFLLKNKAVLYTFIVLVCYFFFVYNFKPLIIYADPISGISPPQQVMNVVSRLIGTLIFLIVLLASTGIRLTQKWYATEKERISIEKEKVETELSFLKAQINPHFLFNTLNSIYTLALKSSEQTPNAVMQLSNMMRYVTTEAKSDTVSLEKELQYVRHFIDLQRLRSPKNMKVETQIPSENPDIQIAPLLLIPFIENAFKYGVSTRENATILIHLFVQNQSLELRVENQKFKSANEEKDKSGIGLDNTKQRLELLYKNHYNLIINDLENKYEIKLKLNLSKSLQKRESQRDVHIAF